MTAGVYGADVAQLRSTAAEFERTAQELGAIRTLLSGSVARTPWRGADAERFRGEWDRDHARALTVAAQRLQDAANTLRRNADAQEQTSAAAGGALLGAGAGASPGAAGAAGGPLGGSATHPPADATADDVKQWWDSLTEEQRASLLADDPGMLGRTDGIPAAVRDEANRAFLESELERLREEEPPRMAGRAPNPGWSQWHDRIATLENAQAMLKADPSLSLLLLDTRDGRVELALAVGDVDSADHVGVYTQGLFSDTADADGVQDQAQRIRELDRTARSMLIGDGRGDESTAMVMWMGYDSPQNVVDVLFDGQANDGATRLASFADGIRAVNSDTHLTGLGHSYGSLVTGIAARETDAFDSVAVFGSPGINGDLGQVNVDADQFYVLANPGDPVALSGHFGGNPAELDGAQRLSTAPSAGLSGKEPPSGWLVAAPLMSPLGLIPLGDYALDQHTSYLVDKSTSQHNLAAVVVGAEDRMIR